MRAVLGIAIVSLISAVYFLTAADSSPSATAGLAQLVQLNERNWEQFVPEGKEVDAIYGDFVLRNAHLTAVIAEPLATRNANMTTKDVGGALIDFTVNSAASDQLNVFLPGKRNYPYRSVEFTAGSPDSAPVTKLTQLGLNGESVAVTVIAAGNDTRPEVRTTYRLGKQDRLLTVESVYHNLSAVPQSITLEDDFRVDGQKEDQFRTPNGIVEEFWLHDRHWGQAYGLLAPGRQLQLDSDARTTKLKYVDEKSDATIMLPPGESFTLTRKITAAAHLLDVRATFSESRGTALQPVTLTLRDAQQSPADGVRLELRQGEQLYGLATTSKDGQIRTALPAGEYTLQAAKYGVAVAEPIPLGVGTAPVVRDLQLEKLNFGRVQTAITDTSGHPLPCKLEFRPKSADIKLNFGPETAEYAVRNLCYAPLGRCDQPLPVGEYDVVISHGPEFDIAMLPVSIRPFEATPLAVQLQRSVNTRGWVSSDFHSHASPSGDNTSSQLGRVINLVCEHIEFAPCTEHNRISSYQPHIDRLRIADYIATVSGMELTGSPLPLNHQNVFPMVLKPHTQDGGGPTTAGNLEEQVERLALWDNRSEKLLQVNHPDVGWMFYDRDGNGEHDHGHSHAFPFMDVMEIHPIDNALDLVPTVSRGNSQFHNTFFNWLQLLNQGFRIYGVVNTDAHYNFHGSGPLRNWIQSSTDNPAMIQHMDMVHAAEQGRLVMSNGPFLEVWASSVGQPESVTAGQDLVAKSGEVALQVRVECPNWLDVDRVFVLANGRKVASHDYTRETHPAMFGQGPVKFEHILKLKLDRDAHVVVVTGNARGSLGDVYGSAEAATQPAAVSNPIFVDVQGDGFTANKDTLDAALPVKFGAKK